MRRWSALLMTSFAGCSLLTPLEGYVTLVPDAGPGDSLTSADGGGRSIEAGRSDAAPVNNDNDASAPLDSGSEAEAEAPTGPELLTNAGFETASGGGCGTEWHTDDSTLDLSSTARTGSHSCLICASTRMIVSADQNLNVVGPASVRLEAWFENAPGRSLPTGYVLYYQVSNSSGDTLFHSDSALPSSTWQRMSYTVTLGAGERLSAFLVAMTGSIGACVVADDASVKKLL
jgi:hypothetical protein